MGLSLSYYSRPTALLREKLILPSFALAVLSLARKRDLATFVHERLKYTILKQAPLKSETEWLGVEVDGYRIVNVCIPPPTRFQVSDLPVSPYLILYVCDFNCLGLWCQQCKCGVLSWLDKYQQHCSPILPYEFCQLPLWLLEQWY